MGSMRAANALHGQAVSSALCSDILLTDCLSGLGLEGEVSLLSEKSE